MPVIRISGVMLFQWIFKAEVQHTFNISKQTRKLVHIRLVRPRWPSGKVLALGPEGSKIDSTEDPSYIGIIHVKSYVGGQTSSRWCGSEVRRGVCQLKCRPRHLTQFQNYEVHPKIAFVLFQNEAPI
ncbi:hypothetical protein AVEN_51854-1 [Araneus ventricosus]|uniref:Uncharacterized protein n=1 Tax=Araneus ventricosus TaxID=182803 RepID=A0A4Y2IXP6_ARAVE|nr:hypothetical protein AVEN_51854-1 [Araneus ventricosus]